MSMVLLSNKKARHEFEILSEYTAGLVLSGPEVKSLRNKSGSLTGSFVKIVGGEAYLLNAQITPYKFADNREYDPKRTRKLLLKKRELLELQEISQQKGRSLVPLYLAGMGRTIKLRFGVGRGLKQFEKRDKLKKQQQDRDAAREISRWQ
jgi:SsrA-binding protein